MAAVLTALGTMTIIALAGWLLALTKVLGPHAPRVLARLVFTLATPSLLVTTIGSADLNLLLTRAAASTWVSTLVVAGIAVVIFALLLRTNRADTTVGALASSYINAGNLGIPVAVYVLGDALAVVPTLLLQLLVLAPVAFAVGDARAQATVSAAILRALRSPLTIGALLGLLLALLPWELPYVLHETLRALGATAAPLALLTLGMSLVPTAPAPGEKAAAPTRHWPGVLVATGLRTLVHPALTYLVAALFGVPDEARFAVVLMAALPTAQNVLVYAMQFNAGQRLARDAQLITTFASLPVMVAVVALLH